MLVRAFQVHIRRKLTQFGARTQHGFVGYSGIKPDVQGIHHLFILVGITAQQLGGIHVVPGVNTALFDFLRCRLNQILGIRMQFLCFFVDKQCDRHTPCALS